MFLLTNKKNHFVYAVNGCLTICFLTVIKCVLLSIKSMHDDQKGGKYVKLSCDFVLGINHLTWVGTIFFHPSL